MEDKSISELIDEGYERNRKRSLFENANNSNSSSGEAAIFGLFFSLAIFVITIGFKLLFWISKGIYWLIKTYVFKK